MTLDLTNSLDLARLQQATLRVEEVHREHHGKGYAVAITLAGARALQQHAATSAVVVAENSNPAALATYLSAGFVAREEVTDLKRP
ncbi:MAG: hypothetical protein Q4G46_14105 [Propionibacteriaceae bacterium]|nr:hypothetical protein [Propionibacteriaceae bacterium]